MTRWEENKVASALPLVSIRMPLFNHAHYVEEALESVRCDGYPNKELIIIDDGSQDGSSQVVRDWIGRMQPEFPVSLTSRENRGIARTLNELIAASRGEFLVSLASDDRLLPGGILRRLDYLLAHPKKKAVIGDCRVIDAAGARLYDSGFSQLYKGRLQRYHTDSGILDEVIRNWSVPGSVLMVHRDIYHHVGPYDERLQIEDWDFYLRLVSEGLLGFVEKPVSEYRLHGSNTALRKDRKFRNYWQMTLTAWRNIPVVPASYRFAMGRAVLRFGIRASVFGLIELLSRCRSIFKVDKS